MNELALQDHTRVDATTRDSLRECDGFRVDSPLGRLGVVQEVRFREGEPSPYRLAISAGLFGGRLLIIDASEIAAILPRQRRLILEFAPALLGTEP
jgi:hypothetical protein